MARPLGRGGNAGRFVGPGLATGARVTFLDVPRAVADAVASEKDRGAIPGRVQTGHGPLFSGDEYEQVSSNGALTIGVGKTVVVATLRYAWPLVGFVVNPGSGTALTAALRVTVRGVQSAVVSGSALAIPAGGPLASQALFIAARAELIITNGGGAPAAAQNVRATLYGMNS